MKLLTYIGAVCIWFLCLYFGTTSTKDFLIWCVITLLIAIPDYFLSRRNISPDRRERALALIWLFVRRSLGVLVAALFLLFSLHLIAAGLTVTSAIQTVISLLLGGFFLRFAWLGAGSSASRTNAQQEYEFRRKRYRWRL